MAVIKSGDSADQLKIDPVSKAARVTLYNSAGAEGLAINGTVEVANDVGNPLPVNGIVSVSNLPATQPVSGTVAVSNLPATQAVSGTVTVANPVSVVTANAGTGTFTVAGAVNADNRVGGAAVSTANPLPVSLGSSPQPVSLPSVSYAAPLPVAIQAANKIQSVAGVANTALTVTLPAPAAGLSQYITSITIQRANGATAGTAGTAALAITSTNLNGLQFRYGPGAIVAGAVETGIVLMYEAPLKAASPGQAVTLVLPAPGGATVYWLVNVAYFEAP